MGVESMVSPIYAYHKALVAISSIRDQLLNCRIRRRQRIQLHKKVARNSSWARILLRLSLKLIVATIIVSTLECGRKSWYGSAAGMDSQRKSLLDWRDDWEFSVDLYEWSKHPKFVQDTGMKPKLEEPTLLKNLLRLPKIAPNGDGVEGPSGTFLAQSLEPLEKVDNDRKEKQLWVQFPKSWG
ncbi:reverse transcriptase [Plakobranchus ocellatus]|uniref:Reverse transcriptase n=1 Tax=Plakobranchus ocellatus TaxID=259542 RepID=A0AAV3ZPB7_9GAST|nr:reverse transcriptase [Plakobranchus ocellatus]